MDSPPDPSGRPAGGGFDTGGYRTPAGARTGSTPIPGTPGSAGGQYPPAPAGTAPLPVPAQRVNGLLIALVIILVAIIGGLVLGMTVFRQGAGPPSAPSAGSPEVSASPSAPFPIFTLTRRATPPARPGAHGPASPAPKGPGAGAGAGAGSAFGKAYRTPPPKPS
jgi:hypothetical protein